VPFTNEVVAGETLVRNAIASALYQAGVSGWRIARDGSAEFNNLTIRGVFNGTDFIINESGEFFYDGTPTANNLIISIANQDGVDAFGNTYLNGMTVYDTAGNTQPVGYIQILQQTIIIGNVDAGVFQDINSGAGQIGGSGSNIFLITATQPGDPNFNDQALQSMISGKSGSATGSATAPTISWQDSAGTSAVDMSLSGNMRRSDLNGIPIAKFTPVAGTGWTLAAAAIRNTNPLRIWIDNNDFFHVCGSIATTTATPSGNILSTALLAPFLPVNNATWGNPQGFAGQQSSAGVFKAMGHIFLQASNGQLQANSFTFASGDIITFDHHWPLGNLP
jgi:hypothetical protein